LEQALLEYPGTILFVTHDRYLVQKIASHLVYIEDGKPHIFDRLSAFEEWLANPPASVPDEPVGAVKAKQASGMSKNKRDRLQKEASDLEARIALIEADLKSIETSFQNPDTSVNWESVHRRYDDLKKDLETLYAELSLRWDALEQNQ